MKLEPVSYTFPNHKAGWQKPAFVWKPKMLTPSPASRNNCIKGKSRGRFVMDLATSGDGNLSKCNCSLCCRWYFPTTLLSASRSRSHSNLTHFGKTAGNDLIQKRNTSPIFYIWIPLSLTSPTSKAVVTCGHRWYLTPSALPYHVGWVCAAGVWRTVSRAVNQQRPHHALLRCKWIIPPSCI